MYFIWTRTDENWNIVEWASLIINSGDPRIIDLVGVHETCTDPATCYIFSTLFLYVSCFQLCILNYMFFIGRKWFAFNIKKKYCKSFFFFFRPSDLKQENWLFLYICLLYLTLLPSQTVSINFGLPRPLLTQFLVTNIAKW